MSQIGTFGPKDYQIWKIRNDDWLASSRMHVIIDQDGNLLAATGGTTAGVVPTAVTGVQAAATVAAGVLVGKGLTELSQAPGVGSVLGVKGAKK